MAGGAHVTDGVGSWLPSPLALPQTHSDRHLAALSFKKGEIKQSSQSEEGSRFPWSMELRFLPLFCPQPNPQILRLPGCTHTPTCQRASVQSGSPHLLPVDRSDVGASSGGKGRSHGPPSCPHPTSRMLGRYNQP